MLPNKEKRLHVISERRLQTLESVFVLGLFYIFFIFLVLIVICIIVLLSSLLTTHYSLLLAVIWMEIGKLC